MANNKKQYSNYGLSEEAKTFLRQLALKEKRSDANMIEALILREKEKQNIWIPEKDMLDIEMKKNSGGHYELPNHR